MSSHQHALEHWLEGRIERWKWLDARSRGTAKDDSGSGKEEVEFVEGFRALGRDLALARSTVPDTQLTRYLTGLSVRCREEIYAEPGSLWRSLRDTALYTVPKVVYELRSVIVSTILLFIVSGLCGWWLVNTFPELVSLFASQKMINTVQSGELWTDDLLNILPSSVLAFSIITNNVVVTLTAFVLGVFYGLGTFYIITMNGLMLGGIFAFTGRYGLDQRLLEFIVAHGVVELSVICLAGAAGLSLGEALMRPGERRRIDAFREAVARAGSLLVVAIPFLVGAGVIEGYISPDDSFPFEIKLMTGLAYGAVFWFVMAGGFWRRAL
ncbi:MAG TPA: stage II sporulation protein M [Gammaproteobacteria bacterium]|nr:stage II sporulation protein M [Gammaproteobacteria bacterium]